MVTNLPDEEAIFKVACQIPSPAARADYLRQICGTDPATFARLQALLRVHDDESRFLVAPPPGIAATVAPAAREESVGTLVGPYKLLEKIGEGGMGLVYMAEQQRPVRRLVALKVVKPGMDSKQVIARFEAERQALALMDHPHIAKVLDAGTVGQQGEQGTGNREQGEHNEKSPSAPVPRTPSPTAGRPFFVMELVRGLPINEFCDQKRLTVRERLQLFVQVCGAVQHAHQKGVIHRDLKPTNVLVTMHDSVAVPKVIDFGIAKALGQSLTDHTLHTGFAQLVGTPLYMSPEQAEFNQLGVDTRSDVYSLGVMLYELLTGMTPFDKESLTKAGLDEMRRIIREKEPLRPSARLSTLQAEALSTISQHRNIDPRRISLALRGELDWIVMKALEKDRSDRYESASALARDIERFLHDEPVQACPPTAGYRFRKFARKHRAVLSTALLVAASLLIGTAVSAWQAIRATAAESQAAANEQKAVASAAQAQEKAIEATTQRDEAKKQRDEVAALADKLHRTLYAAHVNLAHTAWRMDGAERMRELLDQHRPQPGQADLRGFEWFYLNRLCHQEVRTLDGHKDMVHSVAFSPDGKRLASASRNHTVKVWDAQYGKELLSFKVWEPDGKSMQSRSDLRLQTVLFSPDGKRLAGAYANNVVKQWDAQTGRLLVQFDADGDEGGSGHWMDGGRVAYSPDGQRLVCGSCNGPVTVWDAETGKELVRCIGHTDSTDGVAYSPDGKHLASVSDDFTLRIWNAQTGEELRKFDEYDAFRLAFSPDGTRLASAGVFKTVRVWNVLTGERLLTIHGGGSQAVFSPDGKHLVCAAGNSIKVWDAQTGEELVSYGGHTDLINGLALSPDGKQLASASSDATVKLWDVQPDPKPLALQGAPSLLRVMALSPDGRCLAAAQEETARIWDVATGKQLHVLPVHKAAVRSLAFSPDSKRLASAAGEISEPTEAGEVKVWDVQSGKELLHLQGGGQCVAFSRDGKRLVSGAWDGMVQSWDATSGQSLLGFQAHGRGVKSVAISPDGQRLATSAGTHGRATTDGVSVWDAQTGKEMWRHKTAGQFGGSESVTFSPDGRFVAGAFRDKTSKIFDSQTGQVLVTLKGHSMAVGSVVYSPDGKRLATTSLDDTAKVWDTQTGHELLTFKGHSLSASFTPDGHRLIGGAASATLTTYDATPLADAMETRR